MARTFHVLYLPNVSLADAPCAEASVFSALRSIGLLSSRADERRDEVGRNVRRYAIAETAGKLFRKLVPDDFALGDYVESTVGRYANGWSLNQVERYDCPLCKAPFQHCSDAEAFAQILKDMQRAIVEFTDTGRPTRIHCPACSAPVECADWKADVPAAFAHLAFEFSQFPPFNSGVISIPAELFGYGEWLVDLPSAIQSAAAQPVGWSMGRI